MRPPWNVLTENGLPYMSANGHVVDDFIIFSMNKPHLITKIQIKNEINTCALKKISLFLGEIDEDKWGLED